MPADTLPQIPLADTIASCPKIGATHPKNLSTLLREHYVGEAVGSGAGNGKEPSTGRRISFTSKGVHTIKKVSTWKKLGAISAFLDGSTFVLGTGSEVRDPPRPFIAQQGKNRLGAGVGGLFLGAKSVRTLGGWPTFPRR